MSFLHPDRNTRGLAFALCPARVLFDLRPQMAYNEAMKGSRPLAYGALRVSAGEGGRYVDQTAPARGTLPHMERESRWRERYCWA